MAPWDRKQQNQAGRQGFACRLLVLFDILFGLRFRAKEGSDIQ
jgi:hypothetical protein